MKKLIPLQNSAAANEAEAEYKALFAHLWQMIEPAAHDADHAALPFLASEGFVRRFLAREGMGNFREEDVPESALRYLLLAKTYRNGKRGTYLLETFLRCVWRGEFEINQLFCPKDGNYPEDCATEEELEGRASYRTGRLRVSLVSEAPTDFKVSVARMLDETLPARLFVAQILQEQKALAFFGMRGNGSAYSISTFQAAEMPRESEVTAHSFADGDGSSWSLAVYAPLAQ